MGAECDVLRIFGQDFFSLARHDTAYQMIEKNLFDMLGDIA